MSRDLKAPSDNVDVKLLNRQMKRVLERIPPHLLNCRQGADGHHWQRRRPDWKPELPGVLAYAAQCANCTAIKRIDFLARTGEVLRSRATYPEGYILKRVEGDGTEPLVSTRAVRLTRVKKSDADLPELSDVD
jgi:hypothetical protein